MFSAFGVEHAFSKSLKPQHLAAMRREQKKIRLEGPTRSSTYAMGRTATHNSQTIHRDLKAKRKLLGAQGGEAAGRKLNDLNVMEAQVRGLRRKSKKELQKITRTPSNQRREGWRRMGQNKPKFSPLGQQAKEKWPWN